MIAKKAPTKDDIMNNLAFPIVIGTMRPLKNQIITHEITFIGEYFITPFKNKY
jgi:hypothetical protein